MPLDGWPGVTRRALSEAERVWLEVLEGLPGFGFYWVEFEGMRMPYDRKYFRLRVESALECGKGRVWIGDGGELVAVLPNGEHRVLNDFPTTGAGREDVAPGAVGSAPLPEVRDPAAVARDFDLLDAASSEAAKTGGGDEAGASGNQAPGSSLLPPRRPLCGAAVRGSFFQGTIPTREGTHAGRGCKED